MSEIDWSKSPDWATHYCSAHKAWRNAVIDTICDCCIPLPCPSKQEWAGGLPPVGVECRMTLGFGEYDRVKITYMGDGVFCYLNMRTELEYTGALCDATFRPLKSQHERHREDLVGIIQSGCASDGQLADAILSRYNLEPKPRSATKAKVEGG